MQREANRRRVSVGQSECHAGQGWLSQRVQSELFETASGALAGL